MKFTIKRILPIAAIAAASIVGTPAIAAGMADHFKNKTLVILIPYGPGGTYDKYGFAFSKHLGKHIPGKPTVILQHMPGAGGAKAMNYAYNVMQKQGYNMIVPLDNTVVNQLLRPKRMRYKADKFTWLGSSNQTNVVMVVRTDTGVKTIMDMRNIEVIGAASGKSSSAYINPKLIFALLGLKGRMVTGYKGSSRGNLAIEQGEAQMAAVNWLAWSAKVPHWFTGDKPFAKAIIQVGAFKDPDLPDVPMLSDLVKPEDRPLVAFMSSAGALGRGLAVPPGVPKKVIATLRKAYDAMNADPDFAAALKKRKLRLIPSDGETIQKIVAKALISSTPEVIARVRKIIFGTGGT